MNHLYQTITITPQVYDEVVVRGAGLTGSAEIAACKWIEVKLGASRTSRLLRALSKSLVWASVRPARSFLGWEVNAKLMLIDEIKARKVAQGYGMSVLGCVGILEDAFGLHLLSDLARAYRQLISAGACIDRKILENSLKALNLRRCKARLAFKDCC